MQILVPLHTYPDGNSVNLSHHVSSVAKHLGGAVHALLLNADFPPISSPLANLILDASSLVEGAKAQCRKNGEVLLNVLREELEHHGVDLRSTHVEYFPTELTDTVSDIARYHDLTNWASGLTTLLFAAPRRKSSLRRANLFCLSPKTWK